MSVRKFSYYIVCAWFCLLSIYSYAKTTSPYEGRIIKEIVINNRDIFDLSNDEENGSLYRAANYLHIRTNKTTIKSQLLFHSGDEYQQVIIDESERILRQNKYITDVTITSELIDNNVTIYITTFDSWSTKPTVSLGHSGGKSNTAFGLEEDNFLGTGIQLGLSFKKDVDRDSTILKLFDRQIGNSWYQFDAQHQSNSDGHLNSIQVAKPFYSYFTKNTFGISLHDELREDARYFEGDAYYKYQANIKQAEIYKGFSTNISHDGHGLSDGKLRHTFGFHMGSRDFSELDLQPEINDIDIQEFIASNNLVPKQRNETYAFYQLEFLRNKYFKTKNVDKIARTEDIYRGLSASMLLGYGRTSGYLDEDIWKIDAKINYANCNTENILFRGSVFVKQDYISNHGTMNSLAGFDLNILYHQNDQFKIYADLSNTKAHNMYKDQQSFLGGELGFRGYPLRYASGSEISLFTLEQRYYAPYNPFNIINFGAAVFFDAGKVSGGDALEQTGQDIFTSVGFGLRLTSNKSSKGDIVHIDFSRPLDSTYADSKWQFSLVAETTF